MVGAVRLALPHYMRGLAILTHFLPTRPRIAQHQGPPQGRCKAMLARPNHRPAYIIRHAMRAKIYRSHFKYLFLHHERSRYVASNAVGACRVNFAKRVFSVFAMPPASHDTADYRVRPLGGRCADSTLQE